MVAKTCHELTVLRSTASPDHRQHRGDEFPRATRPRGAAEPGAGPATRQLWRYPPTVAGCRWPRYAPRPRPSACSTDTTSPPTKTRCPPTVAFWSTVKALDQGFQHDDDCSLVLLNLRW